MAVCVLLIITILMQAGRGGGLAESFASAGSMFGTQTNSFMVKLSTILAIIFLTTSLVLAINAAKGNKSLMNKAKLPAVSVPAAQPEEPTVKVSEPKPVDSTKMITDTKEVATPVAAAVVTNTAQ